MYEVNFSHKVRSISLAKSFTMYKVNFNLKLGPIVSSCILMHETEERVNYFLLLVDNPYAYSLWTTHISSTMYKVDYKHCHIGLKVWFFWT